jgi:hypothetical protein
MKTESVHHKSEIIAALEAAFQQVSSLIQEISEENLYNSNNGKWSIGENMEHLILSSVGLASVLKKPKSLFKGFGTPSAPSRTYDNLYDDYIKALSKGQKAPSRFSPTEEKRKTKQELLASWEMIIHKFKQRIDNFWTDDDLENYVLPHPALGLLTIREMLYSTIFHTKHHLAAMQKLV